MPLFHVLPGELQLTGTIYGGDCCGPCTLLKDGEPLLSCCYLSSLAVGLKITAIESLDEAGEHPFRKYEPKVVCRSVVTAWQAKFLLAAWLKDCSKPTV